MKIEISNHPASKRIKVIKIKEQELDKLIFPFNKHSIQSLEYKPFSRFSLAKSVDDVFSGELSKVLNTTLKDRNTGTAIIEPDINISNFITKIFECVCNSIWNDQNWKGELKKSSITCL